MSAPERDPLAPLNVTTARNIEPGEQKLDVDVVIVGSGAGGSVAAYELAAAGRSVALLEAGPYVPSSEFTEKYPEMMELLYQDRGAQTNTTGDVVVLQGKCLGGSTVVNAAVAFRTPDHILEHWHDDFGLSDMTPETLDPYFSQVEGRLGIHENLPHEISLNSQLLVDGCNNLGFSSKPVSRNIRNCALSGFCIAGCASDRKQSMLVTYIPWAIEAGAQVFCDTRATEILVSGNRANGVRARTVDPKTGQTVATLTVNSKVVILAGGAVQTPLLLLQNGLANSSGMVGKNFACHPSLGILAEFPREINGWRGATVGTYCDEFEHPDKGGYIFEGAMTGADFMALFSPGIGDAHIRYMTNLKNTAGMISLIHDRNVGEVRLTEDGGKEIHYGIAVEDLPTIRDCLRDGARIFFAAGATRVIVPSYEPIMIESVDQIDAVVDRLTLAPLTMHYTSYHPQGTCRMGSDPANSVVQPTGETHDVDGLFIADASLFPTSIMVNPQVTVYTLATLIAEKINNRAAELFGAN